MIFVYQIKLKNLFSKGKAGKAVNFIGEILCANKWEHNSPERLVQALRWWFRTYKYVCDVCVCTL